MDIEKLGGVLHALRSTDTVTFSLAGVGETKMATKDVYEIIRPFFDEAIARQSVTSEDVQRAIDWLETGDFEVPVGDEEYTANSAHHPNTVRFRQTAIQSLKQYQPVPKSDPNLGQAESEQTQELTDWFKALGETRDEGGVRIKDMEGFAWAIQTAIVAISKMETTTPKQYKPVPEIDPNLGQAESEE